MWDVMLKKLSYFHNNDSVLAFSMLFITYKDYVDSSLKLISVSTAVSSVKFRNVVLRLLRLLVGSKMLLSLRKSFQRRYTICSQSAVTRLLAALKFAKSKIVCCFCIYGS